MTVSLAKGCQGSRSVLSAAPTHDLPPLFRTQQLHADERMSALAGAEGLLTVRDETGSTPAQLAVSKGHRPFGIFLADWRRMVPCWIAARFAL